MGHILLTAMENFSGKHGWMARETTPPPHPPPFSEIVSQLFEEFSVERIYIAGKCTPSPPPHTHTNAEKKKAKTIKTKQP